MRKPAPPRPLYLFIAGSASVLAMAAIYTTHRPLSVGRVQHSMAGILGLYANIKRRLFLALAGYHVITTQRTAQKAPDAPNK